MNLLLSGMILDTIIVGWYKPVYFPMKSMRLHEIPF